MANEPGHVHIGNLHPRVTIADLEPLLIKHGVITNLWVAKNPPGFAFCDYQSREMADRAVKMLDGHKMENLELTVEIARRPKGRPHARGGRGFGPARGGWSGGRDRGRDYSSRDRGREFVDSRDRGKDLMDRSRDRDRDRRERSHSRGWGGGGGNGIERCYRGGGRAGGYSRSRSCSPLSGRNNRKGGGRGRSISRSPPRRGSPPPSYRSNGGSDRDRDYSDRELDRRDVENRNCRGWGGEGSHHDYRKERRSASLLPRHYSSRSRSMSK